MTGSLGDGHRRIGISEHCVGSAQCVRTAPALFRLGADGLAEPIVTDVAALGIDAALDAVIVQAVSGCPMGAVTVEPGSPEPEEVR